MINKILVLGPQGSGKGTQADILAKKLNIPALSMGNLLRAEVSSGSDLGKQISAFIDEGNLVTDEITSAVLKKRLSDPDAANGFILDGYPRFMEQYEVSKTFLEPTAVLVVSVPQEESMKRILKRAEIEKRTDDTPESIERRLTWSREKTEPVIEKFKQEGILHLIDGMGSVEEVEGRIKLELNIS